MQGVTNEESKLAFTYDADIGSNDQKLCEKQGQGQEKGMKNEPIKQSEPCDAGIRSSDQKLSTYVGRKSVFKKKYGGHYQWIENIKNIENVDYTKVNSKITQKLKIIQI